MKDSSRWMLHFAAGGLLLFLLALHMGVMHLPVLVSFYYTPPAGSGAIDWPAVIGRARHFSTLSMYVLCLGAALFHGFYGLWNVLIEAIPRRGFAKPLGWILTFLGVVFFAYGAYTTYLACSLTMK